MNRKIIIVILSIIGTLLVLSIGYAVISGIMNQQRIKKDKATITQVANSFTTAWFNYTTQTSTTYLQGIKPFMADNYYQATYYVDTNRPQDFEGQLPLKSRVETTDITNYANSSATVVQTISSEDSSGAKQNSVVTLSLNKVNGKWLVSNMEQLIK